MMRLPYRVTIHRLMRVPSQILFSPRRQQVTVEIMHLWLGQAIRLP